MNHNGKIYKVTISGQMVWFRAKRWSTARLNNIKWSCYQLTAEQKDEVLADCIKMNIDDVKVTSCKIAAE